MAPQNTHISYDFVNSVLDGTALADVSMLAFRDPDAFSAGNLLHSFEHWEHFARFAPCDLANTVLDWIKNFVKTKYTRESSNINLSWTKIKYQNNLSPIALFFTLFISSQGK